MRGWTATLVMTIGLGAIPGMVAAQAANEHTQPTVVLHVANLAELGRVILDAAKDRVARVYETIGVRIVWDDRGLSSTGLRDGELHLNLLLLRQDMRQKKHWGDRTAADLVGQAHLPSLRASIFYDRIAAMPGTPLSIAPRLGDAIAHEVGHLMLRESSHSRRGIMRESLSVHTPHVQSFNEAEAQAIRAALMAWK